MSGSESAPAGRRATYNSKRQPLRRILQALVIDRTGNKTGIKFCTNSDQLINCLIQQETKENKNKNKNKHIHSQ